MVAAIIAGIVLFIIIFANFLLIHFSEFGFKYSCKIVPLKKEKGC